MTKDFRFIQARLVVTEYPVDHIEISKQLGVEPTKTFTKGEVLREDPSGVHEPILCKQNIWERILVGPNKRYLEENISQALDEISKFAPGVKVLSNRYSVELSVFGSSAEETREAFHIDKELAKKLVELGIELDVDIYPSEEDLFDTPDKKKKMQDMLTSLCKQMDNTCDSKSEAMALTNFYTELEQYAQLIISELSNLAWFYDVRTPEESTRALEAILRRTNKLLEVSRNSSVLTIR